MNLLQTNVDLERAKIPPGIVRSLHWPKVWSEHLRLNPTCIFCGGSRKLEVHHILPFHLHPELELDPSNLATLCEEDKGGINCHLHAGHLGSFKSYNADLLTDAAYWLNKINNRPLAE